MDHWGDYHLNKYVFHHVYRYQNELIGAKTPGFLQIKNAHTFGTVSTIEIVSKNPKVKSGIYFCGKQAPPQRPKAIAYHFEHIPRSERHTEFKFIGDKYVVCKQLSPNNEMS